MLRAAGELGEGEVVTKSGLMVGLGETHEEMVDAFGVLREHDVQVLTVGQYLRPSERHLPVVRYWHPDEFAALEQAAYALGFDHVAAGRSYAPPTTPTSTCRSRQPASDRWRPPPSREVGPGGRQEAQIANACTTPAVSPLASTCSATTAQPLACAGGAGVGRDVDRIIPTPVATPPPPTALGASSGQLAVASTVAPKASVPATSGPVTEM